MGDPLVVHHYDADGIAAAAIVCLARKKNGKETRTRSSKQLDEGSVALLQGERELVFADLGSGQLDSIETLDADCVVIDHHPPGRANGVTHFNPHGYGFDGATECSASAAAFHCFKHLEIVGTARLGITGAVGDMQDLGGFRGLNKEMLDYAVEKGEAKTGRDLRLPGRASLPLAEFLANCAEPFLPGLTGDDKACALFLKNQGIPLKRAERWLKYLDLDERDRQRLASSLITYCINNAVNSEAVKAMAGEIYRFPNFQGEEADAHEFAALLNACGRNNAAEKGVAACMGDAQALGEARGLLFDYRRSVREGIKCAIVKGFDAGPFYLVDCRGEVSDTIIGVVASAYLNSGLVKRNKPAIALSLDGSRVKVSGRGTAWLVEKGLDLGEAFRKAAQAAGGRGGGHDVAAGAAFEATKENEAAFLKKAREVIEVQLEMR